MLRIRERILFAAASAAMACALGAPVALADHPGLLYRDAPAGADTQDHGDPISRFKAGRALATPESAAGFRSVLPEGCPTVNRTTDDRDNSPFGNALPVIKVIYAHPLDVGNRIDTYSPIIQSGAKAISDLVGSESGGALSVRFDIGTFEGPHCLDIQRVELPHVAAYYSSPAGSAFPKLLSDIERRLGPQPGIRNYLIYADLVAPAGIAGEAAAFVSDGADDPAGAIHAGGGMPAVVYGRGGTDFLGSSTPFAQGQTSHTHLEVALHEISHTLGAVQGSAPHTSGVTPSGSVAGHCIDEWDILCYQDGGDRFVYKDPNCDGAAVAPADPYGPQAQAWDCNKDDYFNVNPAPGSYLDTHWNLADSIFLCAVATCNPPDAQRPTVTIDKKPHKKTRAKRARFTFRASERVSFTCKWGRRKPVPCSSPIKRKLNRGKHKLVVRATDRVGLAERAPAKAKFRQIKKKKKKKR